MSEIRTLAPDEKITEPGFYQISIDRHHGQPCDGPSVTSGILRGMELGFPAEVWAFHPLNPDRIERKDTDALRMGRAIAVMIENGPASIDLMFRVLPDERPNRPSPDQLLAIKEGRGSKAAHRSLTFWNEVDKDPRIKINRREAELLINMHNAAMADDMARAVLGGIPEITMAWKDEATGIWCLSRPDQISFDGMISDYKKIAPSGGRFNHRLCDASIDRYGYDMQMAFGATGFESLTGNWPSAVGLLFQSEEPPHFCIARAIEDEDLKIGAFRNARSLTRFKECLDSGEWPAPGDDVGSYRRREGDRERFLEEMQTAGVAP